MSRALRHGAVIALASALSACGAREASTAPVDPPDEASATPVSSAAPLASSQTVRKVRPTPLVPPSGSSGLQGWLPPGASSAEATALAWALLEGRTPAAGLPQESYGPNLSVAPTLQEGEALRGGLSRAPSIRMGATRVEGKLPPEVIQRIVRQNFGRFRLCYENGLRTRASLQGRVAIDFVIDRQGSVKQVKRASETDLPDPNVVSCVLRAFGGLSFPEPESGTVSVHYPIMFAPGT